MKLSANESALGPSPKAVAAYRKAANSLAIYPDGESLALRETLAAHHGLPVERIVCGAGSDELLYNLARAYAGPGDEVLYSEHGFNIYPIAARCAGAARAASGTFSGTSCQFGLPGFEAAICTRASPISSLVK